MPELRAIPPTATQAAWLKAHPEYVRTSHVGHLARFRGRGTLRVDGTFVPEAKMPVVDGGGDFGVGVPVMRRRRR